MFLKMVLMFLDVSAAFMIRYDIYFENGLWILRAFVFPSPRPWPLVPTLAFAPNLYLTALNLYLPIPTPNLYLQAPGP